MNIKLFESNIEPVTESGCWLWTGTIRMGYGRFWADGKRHSAHRLSYQINKGPIPNGLHVCHKCDVPSCVNPEHLFVGTRSDNQTDSVMKGRSATALITEKEVIEIRKSPENQAILAKRYGVSASNISAIKCRRSWKHVTGEGQ